MRLVTRTTDGSALNLDASDPSFAPARSMGLAPRSSRRRVRLRVSTVRGSSFTVDAGPGGVCTEQMRVLAVGAPIEGHIYLDGTDSPFQGRVVWARAGDSRLNQLGRMGVRFDRIGAQWAPGLARRASLKAPGRW